MENSPIGPAVTEANPKQYDLEEFLTVFSGYEAIEVQPTTDTWQIEPAVPMLEKIGFRSVHAPCVDVEMTSKDEKVRERAVQITKYAMDMASQIGAQVFVLHAVQFEEFAKTKEREQRRKIFLDVFKNLIVPYHKKQGHEYIIGIENIEYGKYPATLAETLELEDICSRYVKSGIVLDIAHEWNNRRILLENPDDADKVLGYPSKSQSLIGGLRTFIDKYKEKIVLVHAGNFGEMPEKFPDQPIRTHEPITPKDVNPELEEALQLVKGIPVILEIYGGSRWNLDSSVNIVQYMMKR